MKCKLYTVMARECGENFRLSYNGFSKEEAIEKAVEHLKLYIEDSPIEDTNFEDCKKSLIKTNEVYVDNVCEIVINETESNIPTIYGIKYDIYNNGWGIMSETFLTSDEADDFLRKYVEKHYGDEDEESIFDSINEGGSWYIEDKCYFDIIQLV